MFSCENLMRAVKGMIQKHKELMILIMFHGTWIPQVVRLQEVVGLEEVTQVSSQRDFWDILKMHRDSQDRKITFISQFGLNVEMFLKSNLPCGRGFCTFFEAFTLTISVKFCGGSEQFTRVANILLWHQCWWVMLNTENWKSQRFIRGVRYQFIRYAPFCVYHSASFPSCLLARVSLNFC